MLCVVRARGVEHVEDEVLVVSLDRLAPALRAGAGNLTPPPVPGRADLFVLSGNCSGDC